MPATAEMPPRMVSAFASPTTPRASCAGASLVWCVGAPDPSAHVSTSRPAVAPPPRWRTAGAVPHRPPHQREASRPAGRRIGGRHHEVRSRPAERGTARPRRTARPCRRRSGARHGAGGCPGEPAGCGCPTGAAPRRRTTAAHGLCPSRTRWVGLARTRRAGRRRPAPGRPVRRPGAPPSGHGRPTGPRPVPAGGPEQHAPSASRWAARAAASRAATTAPPAAERDARRGRRPSPTAPARLGAETPRTTTVGMSVSTADSTTRPASRSS